MTTKNSKKGSTRSSVAYHCFTGQETYLDRRILPGLFEACNGHRYLIARSGQEKHIISLSHSHLPPLTWRKLGKQRLEYGNWWGKLDLRLTHVAQEAAPEGAVGIIKVDESWACLSCPGEDGGVDWVPIGWPGSIGELDGLHFDGWTLYSADIGHAFLTRSPDGGYEAQELTIDVPPDCPDVIELEVELD